MRTLSTLLTLGLLATAAAAGTSEVEFQRARLGEEHPDVRLPTIDRADWLALSDFRGRKLLLIEFASW
jgi:hypothetical protein